MSISKHNKKYLQIIHSAKELFWRYGIKRVTIEEICREATVSKVTFYKFFNNKTDLVKQLLDKVFGDAMDQYTEIMRSNRPYREKITDLALMKLNATNDISHEFLNDYYNINDDQLSDFLQAKVNESIGTMLNDFIKAQEQGEIRSDIKPEFIMYFLNNLVVMGNDPNLSSIYTNAQDMIIELMNFFFYGILPRGDNRNNEEK